jgi:hypothetical protein
MWSSSPGPGQGTLIWAPGTTGTCGWILTRCCCVLAYAVADLPGETAGYRLPAVPGGIGGWRVGVVDDAVNAGTAVVACLQELRGRGAVPVAVATLVSLGEASTTSSPRYLAGRNQDGGQVG